MNAPEPGSKRFEKELRVYRLQKIVVEKWPWMKIQPWKSMRSIASQQVSGGFRKAKSILLKPVSRPYIILATALIVLFLIVFTLSVFDSIPPPFDKIIKVSGLSDRALGPVLLVLLAAPFAFIVWCFRDANAQKQIATHRKDVLLKEFEGVKKGAADESYPALQIASISQLKAFLNKEFIDEFQRPAWDMIRALLQQYDPWNRKPDERHLQKYKDYREVYSEWLSSDGDMEEACNYLKQKLALISTPQWGALSTLIKEEAYRLFHYKLPHSFNCYSDINFIDVKFPVGVPLTYVLATDVRFDCAELRSANFVGAHLQRASFVRAQLQRASFERAQLQGAKFEGAQLKEANFMLAQLQGAIFNRGQLHGAIFVYAKLQRANFEGAQLQNANFIYVHLQGASFNKAQLQGAVFKNVFLKEVDFRRAHMNLETFNSILVQAYPNNPEGWTGIVCIEDISN